MYYQQNTGNKNKIPKESKKWYTNGQNEKYINKKRLGNRTRICRI